MTTSTDRESAFATEHVDPAIEPQASPELQTWRDPARRPVPLGPPVGADSLQGWTQPRPRRITIIVPTLNEEAGITQVLGDIPRSRLRALGFDPRILVVDGNSTDQTRELAEAMGAKVHVQEERGKGNAFREIVPLLEGEFAVMVDGDGTYPVRKIPELIELLDSGYDVVSGSRLAGDIESAAMSGLHRLGNRALTGLANALYRDDRTSDLCTGLWGFRTKALKQMRLSAQGFELEADLYSETVSRGFRYTEVPIAYAKRHGETKLSAGMGLRIALKLVSKKFGRGA